MELVQLNPFIRYLNRHYIHYVKKEASVCYDCRLFYVISGTGNVCVQGCSQIVLNKDYALFFPPDTHYQFYPDSGSSLELLVVNFDLTTQYCHLKETLGTPSVSSYNQENVLRYELPPHFAEIIVCDYGLPIREYLLKAEKERSVPTFISDTLISTYIKLALIKLITDSKSGDANLEIVHEVCEYVRQNYRSELTNKEIAEKFHYHPHYLSKILKDETGKTLRQYLIHYRLSVAKTLLVSTDLSITEVAWKAGFTSTSYFIKVFRSITKQTPGQYRSNREKLHF